MPLFRHRMVEQGEGVDPSGQPVKPFAGVDVAQIARFQPDQRGDHLQIVLHPVLELAQQDVLLSHARLDLVQFRPIARADRRQGDQTEHRRSVVIQNDIGPGVDDDRLAVVDRLEDTDVVFAARDRLAQILTVVLGGGDRAETVPGLALDVGGGLARQTLELEVCIGDAF